MPYKNIVFVKLLWKELLHDDDRFIEKLNDEQKGLYLMLLLLAGATNNNIKDDENYLKRVLNLQNYNQNIRKNVDKICEVFSGLISRNGFLKFKNFKKIHNYLRNADGTPKETQRIAKNRIDKIRIEYIKIKAFRLEDFSSDDFARTAKAIKSLLLKTNNDDLVIEGLRWASRQNWCDWTLETVNKKWPDFMKERSKPKSMSEYKSPPQEEKFSFVPPKGEVKKIIDELAGKKKVE